MIFMSRLEVVNCGMILAMLYIHVTCIICKVKASIYIYIYECIYLCVTSFNVLTCSYLCG